MSEPYVPTTEEVCDGFRGDPRKFEQAGEPIDAIGSNYGSKCYAAFHRWLAEHDARIRREALTLSDDEVKGLDGLLEKELETQTFIEAISSDDWNLILSNIFAAVAASRERES